MGRSGAAAAADDVEEARIGELAEDARGIVWRFVVAAHFVREARVRVHGDATRCDARQLLHIGAQIFRAERAVEADRERIGVRDGIEERFGGLARERAP